jgi:hypothetical protein
MERFSPFSTRAKVAHKCAIMRHLPVPPRKNAGSPGQFGRTGTIPDQGHVMLQEPHPKSA